MFRNSQSFLSQRVLKLLSFKSSAGHQSTRCLGNQQVRCYCDKRSNSPDNESLSSATRDQYDEPILASKAPQTYRADLSSTKLLTNHQPLRQKKSDPDEANLFGDFREPSLESTIDQRPTNNQESHGIFNPAFSVVPRPSFKRRLNREDFRIYQDAEKRALENLNLQKYEELYNENAQFEQTKRLQAISPELQKVGHFDDRSFFDQYLENRQFKEHQVEMFEELVKTDRDRERIKMILSEYELEKYNTSQVPTVLTVQMMAELLGTNNEFDLLKLLKSFFRKEVRKVVVKSKRELEKKLTRERLDKKYEDRSSSRTGMEFTADGVPIYGKWKTTMFIGFNRETLRKANDRLVRDAILFGPRLAIDFGYSEELMKPMTYQTMMTQIYFTLNEIRKARTPFHLNLCNLQPGSQLERFFRKEMPYMFQPNSLINVTSQSYLDIFPRKSLVYLTADAERTLPRVDPEKVYVIGGLCDKFSRGAHSYNKARSEGVPAFKLPLEQYFFFKLDRTLTVNAVTGILCNYLEKPDWRHALIGKIPTRKLKTPDEIRYEQYRKVKKFFSKEKYFKVHKYSEELHGMGAEKQPKKIDSLYDEIFPVRPTMPIYNESYRKRGALRDYVVEDDNFDNMK